MAAEGVTVLDRGVLARAVAAAAGAAQGVAALVPGGGVPAVTQVPGDAIVGVALGGSAVSVHVVIDRLPLEPVVTGVAAAVATVLADAGDERRVEVVVEDVVDEAVESALRRGTDGGEVR